MSKSTKVTALAVATSILSSLAPGVGASVAGDRQLGAAIYFDGRMPDGSPLRSHALGGEIKGPRAACATCHRPSGHGMSEGELDVPRVTGPTLFEPLDERRVDLLPALYETPLSNAALATARTPRRRPAYDRETLARAITIGVDPLGRTLHRGMPRYRLEGRALDALIAFLDDLGRNDEPGVTESEIHFASVIAGDVVPERQAAMAATIDAFVRQHNFDLSALDAHLGRFPHRKDLYAGARRQWRVHLWRLYGSPEDWETELAAHYAKRPVFALLGGVAAGGWAPIHRFCETRRLPCLFPDTDLPAKAGFWTVYFSQGLALEAELLARWFSERPHLLDQGPVVQVIGEGAGPAAFAAAFSDAIGPQHARSLQTLGPRSGPTDCPGLTLFWVAEGQTAVIDETVDRCAGETQFIASGGLLGEREARLLRSARPMIGMTYPFALAQRGNPDSVRHRAWMRSRRIESRDPLTEAKTYFALDAARHALRHIVDRFSRTYLLESIEHVAEDLSNPGLYDRLSLAAGQRFAAKGIYIYAPDEPAAKPSWVVP